MAITRLQVHPFPLAVSVYVWSIIINTKALTDCVDGDVRLIGGNHYREGKVEVCRSHQWGRVCDDMWDEKDSVVVCKQLGLSEEGAIAFAGNMGSFSVTNPSLPFVLDDLGCNGTERNLLECLPQHNCGSSSDETAGVECLRKGVTLEYGSYRLENNSLISVSEIGEGSEPVLCATDRTDCCSNESDSSAIWYTPNGYRITQLSTNSSSAFYISMGNQTVGLNYHNGTRSSVSTGIYNCEVSDKSNVISYLYIGIYHQNQGNVEISSISYESTTCTIVCKSTGGPATTVLWSKDNNSIQYNDHDYEHSSIIVNRTSATYENRLVIINKSSNAAGIYTCTVINSIHKAHKEFHLEVCSDMELRFNSHSRNVEVCFNDHWHPVVNSAVIRNSTLGNITYTADSTSVTITWTPPSGLNISTSDIMCTTIIDEQIHLVKLTDVNMSSILISGLLPGQNYECCIRMYITVMLFDTSSLRCITATTLLSPSILNLSCIDSSAYIIGLGISVSSSLLLLGVCIFMCLLFIIKRRKLSVKKLRVSADRDNVEHMVVNPIYYTESMNESIERKLIAENPQYGTRAQVTYEMINDLPSEPRRTAGHRSGVPVQTKANSKINQQEELENDTLKESGEDGCLSTEQMSQQKISIYDLPLDP